MNEKLKEIFATIFGYDEAKSGHVGNRAVTVSELRQVLSALGDQDNSEDESENPVDNPAS